jgi:hypothetical protein
MGHYNVLLERQNLVSTKAVLLEQFQHIEFAGSDSVT